MTSLELKIYIQKNEPALFKSIGKYLDHPSKALYLIIRHFQWNYQWGDYRNNDMGDRLNDNHRMMFTFILQDNQWLLDKYINIMIKSFKVAYDYKFKTWNKQVIIDIMVKSRHTFWYDLLSFYTLIAGTYEDVRPLLEKVEIDPTTIIPKTHCIDLFDAIITDQFASELIDAYKLELDNIKRT